MSPKLRQPFDGKATRSQHRRCPKHPRRQVGDLEWDHRHSADTRNQRHNAPERPKEPANENTWRAPPLEKRPAFREQRWMAGQRPETADRLLVMKAQPVGDPVTKHRAGCGRPPDRPKADSRGTYDTADADQQDRSWQQQGNKSERF